jgi:signal transduction histidine kinase
MQDKLLACVDWFIPSGSSSARSEMSLKRIFVATHLVGPTFSQSIGIYLLHADSNPNWIAYTIIAAIASFWLVPLVFKFSKNLEASAFLSFNLLAMTSFFGAFFYGGVSSPFLPWVIIALLLGFFYLSSRPLIVISCFAFWSFLFFIMHLGYGFPNRINLDKLQTLGWISISGAVTYMSWMAMFYSTVVSGRHDVELELTRHKLTAQRLQEAKSIAEAANKSRSIFLTKMSHELRTPLNAVIGYSELLVDTYEDEGASPQKTKDLLRISASGKHLLALVDQVLDLSKIESDVIDVHPSTMDLRAFADEIEATALPLTARNQNQFSMVLPTRPGLMNTDSRSRCRSIGSASAAKNGWNSPSPTQGLALPRMCCPSCSPLLRRPPLRRRPSSAAPASDSRCAENSAISSAVKSTRPASPALDQNLPCDCQPCSRTINPPIRPTSSRRVPRPLGLRPDMTLLTRPDSKQGRLAH